MRPYSADRCRWYQVATSPCSRLVRNITLAVSLVAGPFASLPCVAAVSPRALVEVIDIGSPIVSPDGRSVAFRTEQASIERNTYDTVWYVQRLDGGTPPIRVADGGLPLRSSAGTTVPTPATWSPDGKWIYYRALLDGRINVWRAATDGGGSEPLTHDPANVRDFALSEDGRVLYYSMGADRAAVIAAEQTEYDRGVRIDASVPIGQGLFRSSNLEGRLATQRYTGDWFERETLLANVPVRWKARGLTPGTAPEVWTVRPPPAPFGPSDLVRAAEPPWQVARDPSTGRVAILTRFGDGEGLAQKPNVRLSILAGPRARQPLDCTAALCAGQAITMVQWRPGSDEVIFTITDPEQGQAQRVGAWNVASGHVRPVVQATGLLSGGRDAYTACGVSAAALVCVAAGADVPPRLERIDLVDGTRAVLFDPNAALAADTAQTARARLLRWTDARGQDYTGQFFAARSSDGRPAPLFVTYYSCAGYLRGGVGDEWPLASLASHGIAALCINQVPQFALDAVVRYDHGLSAVASVVDHLASAGEIDRARVGMGGLSFGTEVTLWTAMHSDLLAAASVSSTMLSPLYYLMGSLKGEDFTLELDRVWQVGAPGMPPARWQQLSPALNLDAIRAPLLLQMPEQEYLRALDYAIPLIRARTADLYVFAHEPHIKFQPKHKLAVYERNFDWFTFWLLGTEDPDPAKAEQYLHWREMKSHAKILR